MNDEPSASPRSGDALIVIDVQRDFLPGGALAVPEGDQVVEPLNRYVRFFASRSLPVFASRDWHPANHCSFAEQGGPWPAHCVQGTSGAQFVPQLNLPEGVQVISKATQPDREAYSDFSQPDFDERLRREGVRRLFVGGLATEFCVLATVRDALARGYDVVLLTDAIRAIDRQPGDGRRAVDEMTRLGAVPLSWEDIARAPD
jgi:nicotinamidase/pyrazinamidase